MVRASKTIAGVVYIELPTIAVNVKCAPERIECLLKGKSQTNIVSLCERWNYTEYILQTQTASEDEAHTLVTLAAEDNYLFPQLYPNFLSVPDKSGQFEYSIDKALLSLAGLLERDGLNPNKNYIIVKRELKTIQ